LSGHRVPTFSVFVAFVASFLLIGSAQAEVKVLTSIKPLQLIAAAVQDGVAIPEVLLPPGASPHNYALRPSDVRKCNRWTCCTGSARTWKVSCHAC
jgi:zinc transport system substrate-binding protein